MALPHRHATYRPDVDGLRAVAVLSVILYHAGLKAMPGGYVGVDIFFVISGFVITTAIQPDLFAGRFSTRDFYERRIRRIFPPLFLMVAVSLAIGWFVMMPDDFKRLGQSSVANSVFLSNFYFMKDTGYFGATAAAKPLLHTWSLAVEEQFYLLLPLYPLLLLRWSGAAMRWLTVGICMASLLLSVFATQYEPNLSFFLLPTRAWELLVGVLLAQGLVPAPRKAFEEWARALAGIGLIAFSVVFYSEKTVFPGMAAIPPVLGSALIISAGMPSGGGGANAWLASRPMVFIGKISYPLYLWHFPLLGFAGYLSLSGLGFFQTAAVNVMIFAIAVVSWRYVERPVRERRVLAGQRALFLFGFLCITATLLGGLAIHFKRGVESRFDGDQLKIVRGMTDRMVDRDRCMNLSTDQIASGNWCRFGSGGSAGVPDIAIWGDSHGEALAPGISDVAARAGKQFLFAGHHGCAIGVHLQDTGWDGRACSVFSKATFDYLVATPTIRQVVLVSRWAPLRAASSAPLAGTTGMSVAASLTQVVVQLAAAGKHVWLVSPVPDVKTLVPRALYLKSLGLESDFELRPSEAAFYIAQKNTLSLLGELADRPGVSLISPHEVLCSGGWCEVEREGRPLYFDDNHLTTYGAKWVGTIFEPVFK